MPRADSPSPLGTRFDDFLYADVSAAGAALPLTVLSLMARLDLDPWDEAARLAQLPGAAATRRLAGLLGAQPDGSAGTLDPASAAARLVALLPRGAAAAAAAGGNAAVKRTPAFRFAMLYLVIMALVVLGQWLRANPPAAASGHPAAEISAPRTGT